MKKRMHYLFLVLLGVVVLRDPFFLPSATKSLAEHKKVSLVGIAHAKEGCYAIVDIEGVRHCVTKGQKAAEYLVQALNEQSIELVDRGDVLKLSVV